MQNQENKFIPYHAAHSVGNGKVLVFAPHPDDEVFGCGGAIIRHVANGNPVRVIIVTDGAFPVSDAQKRGDYGRLRKGESIAAAGILGYGEPEFLDYPDRGLSMDEQFINHLRSIIDKEQPDFIYLPAESEIHPDHIALHKGGSEAAQRYGKAVTLVSFEVGQMQKTNLLLDITDIQEQLNDAMDCFESQLSVQDYKRHIHALHIYRTYTLGPEIDTAEAYFLKQLNTRTETPKVKKQSFVISDQLPLISIIVRSMGRPQLEEALQSISEQTYPALEVIVVDAQGTNQLILDSWDSRLNIKVVEENKHLNRPDAANAGLKAVTGKYFCFLDEDDLFLPGHLELLYHQLSSSDALAAYSSVEMVNELGVRIRLYDLNFSFERLFWMNYIPINALLFKSEIIRMGCTFDPALSIFEDWDFLLQAAVLSDFVFDKNLGGIYRNLNSSGVHFDQSKKLLFQKKIYKKWIGKISDPQFNALFSSLNLRFEQIDQKDFELKQINEEVNQNKEEIKRKQEELKQKEEELKCRMDELRLNALAIEERDGIIKGLLSSFSWRITKPMRCAANFLIKQFQSVPD